PRACPHLPIPHVTSSLSFFIFSFARPHRDLHSFPTRRSSDFSALNFFDAAAPLVTYESVDMSRAWFASRYDKGSADYINCALSEDRKSTRLNSSHVSISYAVFCLKKKNKNSASYVQT